MNNITKRGSTHLLQITIMLYDNEIRFSYIISNLFMLNIICSPLTFNKELNG
jgi:hypothetical protein